MKLSPTQMAAIYQKRLGRWALSEVNRILAEFRHSEATTRYWAQVKACLRGAH